MITRSPRPESNFYVLSKDISEDQRLSWAARGMLVFLLGKPDNWTVSPAALVNETAKSARGVGRDGVYAVLKELKEVGYLRVVGARKGGAFAGADYLVSETPHTDIPDTANPPHTGLPHTAQPDTANPPLIRTDIKQVLNKNQVLKKTVADAPAKTGASNPAKTQEAGKTEKPGPAVEPGIELANRALALPDWMPVEEWKLFEQLRWAKHSKRTPYTAYAQSLLVKKLADLREKGQSVTEILEASLRNGWTDLYAIKGTQAQNFTPSQSRSDQRAKIMDGLTGRTRRANHDCIDAQ